MKRKKRGNCLNCGKELHRIDTKFCNNFCQMRLAYTKYIERWKAGFESGISGKEGTSQHIRRYLYELHNSKCQECGWNKINPTTNKVPLTIEHIDGDWTNNKESNLKLLCPNCHSLTSTYGALNKGSGRAKRYAVVA